MTDEMTVVGMMAFAAFVGAAQAFFARRDQRFELAEAQALSPEAIVAILAFSAAAVDAVRALADLAGSFDDVGRASGRAGGRSRR